MRGDKADAKSSTSTIAPKTSVLGNPVMGRLLGGADGSDLGDFRSLQQRRDDRERVKVSVRASRANDVPVPELGVDGGKQVQAYIPVGKKRLKQQVAADDSEVDAGMERYLRLQELLYAKQDTVGEISTGIRRDQVAIANSLNKDMLLYRIYVKIN